MSVLTRRRAEVRGDDGYVLIFVALMMFVCVAMAAFAVDISNWYLQGQREQRAADAAALAGVVFLPSDSASATTVATSAALLNGYGVGAAGTVSVVPVPNRPNQLRVTVTNTVSNSFGSLLGVNATTISRTAIAEYEGPLPMGSPVNGMGDEPLLQCVRSDFAAGATGNAQYTACRARQESRWVSASSQGHFWLHVSTPQRAKSTGDAYQSFSCAASDSNCPGGANTDYTNDGYFYMVRVPATVGQLQIQAFDPAAIDVGDTCTSNLTNASAIDPNLIPDAKYRYASGATSPFCTGDSGGDGVTTFIVRAPDSTPWSNTDNPVLCTAQFSGFSGALVNYLTPGTVQYAQVQTDGHTIAQEFRQWVSLCSISGAEAGDYPVQVRTNVSLGDPLGTHGLVTNANSSGNRFALRAANTIGGGPMPATTGSASGVSMFASGSMGIYANETGANTTFYFARVLPDAAGRTLNLNFFDSGDASQAGIIQVLANGAGLTGCSFTGPTGPDLAQVSSTCTINPVTSATMNGKWMSVAIPVPNNYSCTPANALDCWFQVKFTYPTGTTVNDTTSWSANLNGDPVRLIG